MSSQEEQEKWEQAAKHAKAEEQYEEVGHEKHAEEQEEHGHWQAASACTVQQQP